jgi:mono/diheme cytochrome c family protein
VSEHPRRRRRSRPIGSVGIGVGFLIAALASSTALADPTPMRTYDSSAERIAMGQQTFAMCGSCHGPDGRGRVGMGPSLVSSSFLAAASDDLLTRTITKGRAGTAMIPWGAVLNDEQVASVVVYLRSLEPAPAAELDESKLRGVADDGRVTFESICVACHGRAGGGYLESANGTGIGRKAFLSEVSNGYLRYVIANGKTGTPMRPFSANSAVAVANLTSQQIEDVIAFLRSQAW